MTHEKMSLGFAFGGKAVEHDLSVKSALYILANINREQFDVFPLYVDQNGILADSKPTAEKIKEVLAHTEAAVFGPDDYIPDDFVEWLLGAIPAGGARQAMDMLQAGQIDLVFPVFHGQKGEDGIFQGFLETMGIPYIGCGVTGSVIGNDKAYNKAVCRNAGILVTDFMIFDRYNWERESEILLRKAEILLGMPVFVKPPSMGSSIGVSKAENVQDLRNSVEEVLTFGDRVLVEKALSGVEYGVGIIGNNKLMQSAIVEFGGRFEFLDFAAKYGPDAYDDVIPARLSARQEHAIRKTAARIYRLLNLNGMARLDFFLADEILYFNEANTVPGFGKTSVFSRMWEAAGIDLEDMVSMLVDLALEEKKLRTNGQSPDQAAIATIGT